MLNPQDLQRLIDIITEEVIAAQGAQADLARCACHSVLQRLLPGPAARRGRCRRGAARHARHRRRRRAASPAMIDHTLLKPDATRAEIEKLCREAAEFNFATVCVNPAWVAESARLLRGSGVGVCSVVGFPLGATTADVKHYETRRAIFDGATRDRHGHQRRRAEVRRSAHGRARHRSRGRAVPRVRRRSAR